MAKVNDDGKEIQLTKENISTARLTADTPGSELGWVGLNSLLGESFPMGEKISTIAELDGDKGATVGVHEVSLDRNHPVFGYNYFSLITLPTNGDDAGESQLAIVPSDDLSSPTRLYIRMGSSGSWGDWALVNGGGITDLSNYVTKYAEPLGKETISGYMIVLPQPSDLPSGNFDGGGQIIADGTEDIMIGGGAYDGTYIKISELDKRIDFSEEYSESKCYYKGKEVATTNLLPSIVQTTGQSTTAVMSQKAVTDAINNAPATSGVRAADIGLDLVTGSADTEYKYSDGSNVLLYQTQINVAAAVNDYSPGSNSGVKYLVLFHGELEGMDSYLYQMTHLGVDSSMSTMIVKVIFNELSEFYIQLQAGVKYPLNLLGDMHLGGGVLSQGTIIEQSDTNDEDYVRLIVSPTTMGNGKMKLLVMLETCNRSSETYLFSTTNEGEMNIRLNFN